MIFGFQALLMFVTFYYRVVMDQFFSETQTGLQQKHYRTRISESGRLIINEIKSSLETICPETVSCADIIQLAARDAVYLVSYISFLKDKETLKKIL